MITGELRRLLNALLHTTNEILGEQGEIVVGRVDRSFVDVHDDRIAQFALVHRRVETRMDADDVRSGALTCPEQRFGKHREKNALPEQPKADGERRRSFLVLPMHRIDQV